MTEERKSGRLARLNERVPLLVVAVWAWLYLPRPFQLGFYHDDWWAYVEATVGSAPFSWARFKVIAGNSGYAPRPLGGLLSFVFNSICGTSAFRYHVCVALLVLLAALSMRAWFFGLLSRCEEPARTWAADLGVAFWLSVPWSFGATAWPISAMFQVPAQIFFTEAFRRLLPPREVDRRGLVVFGVGLTASYLTYEAFYFQFFLVAVFYLVFERQIFKNRAGMVWFAGVGVGTQILVLGFNRYVASVNAEFSKKFDPQWLGLFRQNVMGLPGQLLARMGRDAQVWTDLVLVFGGLALLALAIGLARRAMRGAAGFAASLVVVGAGALVLMLATYSLARYGVITAGLESRTLFPVCWALTLVFLGMVLLLLQLPGKATALVTLAVALGIIGYQAIAQKHQVREMSYVWNQELAVLARAPVSELKALPKDSRVLFIGPSYFDDIVIFGAYWDITGAVFSLPPLNEGRQAYKGLTMMDSATTLYEWTWDGKNLVQNLPGYWKETRPATHLFVWKFEEDQFFEAQAGFRWPAK